RAQSRGRARRSRRERLGRSVVRARTLALARSAVGARRRRSARIGSRSRLRRLSHRLKRAPASTARHGPARTLSKLAACSRTQAAQYAREGRIAINGRIVRDPETPVDAGRDRIALDGREIRASERIYLMLNKPRGYVTTAADERGRETVYALLE